MNDTVIIFCSFSCMCRAQLWAESLGVPYSTETWKAVCSQDFSESDFIFPECICLNRMVVPTFCATNSLSHSTPQPTERSFCNPPVSSSSPLVAWPDYLPVQKPIKTYSKLSITTSKTFSSTEPSIPLGHVNKNTCGGELGSVSLQSSSAKCIEGILYKKSFIWTELLNWHPGKRNCITWFRPERVPIASLGRSRG